MLFSLNSCKINKIVLENKVGLLSTLIRKLRDKNCYKEIGFNQDFRLSGAGRYSCHQEHLKF